jgi:adenine-specific DNA-methyltransferase
MTDSHAESTAIQPAPTEQPERLDLRSHEIVGDKQAEIVRLFPEVRTEGGKIDFDRLKLVLGETVDPGKERYGMHWPGKVDCFKAIQSPSLGTLLPSREESLEFEKTQNLIIEGDNLEVLKLMQKAYLGKIKMIYIDPPYNTGNDFIYPDDYSETLQTYLAYTGQVDNERRKFSTNTDADGRFHSKWMNMMYPRLFLARNLLRDDGLLFVSIDDGEGSNLRKICDEIFGEENFLEQIVWKKRYNAAKEKHIVSIHEYVVIYAKRKDAVGPIHIPATEAYKERYFTEKDEKFAVRGGFRTQPLEAGRSMDDRENLVFPVPAPDGTDILPKRQWVWGRDRVMAALAAGDLKFGRDKEGKWTVSLKQYQKDETGEDKETKAFSIIDGIYTQHGTAELTEIFGSGEVFPFPKPVGLIRRLLDIAQISDGDLVLDFFAGSGTTAHALLERNREDGGNRKYILVQLPEPTGREDFKTISDITKERVRRVIKRLDEDKSIQPVLGDVAKDRGFRVFKLDESNFRLWDSSAAKIAEGDKENALVSQLQLHIDHIRDGRSAEDLLFELLMKSGFPLSTTVEITCIDQKTVYSVAVGALLICVERALTLELIKQLGERKPERVILLDEGFAGNDQLKTNAVQIMKSKGVTSFRTV